MVEAMPNYVISSKRVSCLVLLDDCYALLIEFISRNLGIY